MSKRRKFLTELEIEELMQNISDIDSETDSDSSDSDTIIYSDCSVHKESSESNEDEDISDISMPSTSKANTSP
ncbi:hypothetical protein TNCV_3715171 [Trichonephila clavipes]|nr:hypothetical protein TNCV_3715171 [Trichonephila clavipes]